MFNSIQSLNTYKNIVLVGTSHIAKKSAEKIKKIYDEFQPDIICVELDKNRVHALLTNAKPNYSLSGIKQYGLQGYLFAVIASFIQKKLGNVVGTQPGVDMLSAVKLAKNNNKQLELIDQDIQITLKKFSKKFSFKEKMRLFWDIISAPFAKQNKKLKISLTDVPDDKVIHMLMEQMKSRYPNLYYVIVEERNQIMAKNIQRIMEKSPDKKIMVVIGAGHESELIELIKKQELRRDRIK